MPRDPRRAIVLKERDRAILDHVARFRMSTPEVIRHLYFGETSPNAVTKVTRRLREAGYLADYPLFEKHIYFVPGPRADPGNVRAGQSLGPIALVRSYGVLAHCCSREEPHSRLTAGEWEKVSCMLALPSTFQLLDYYLERRGEGICLNWIRVDHGAERRRLAHFCRTKVEEWLETPGFAELVRLGRFAVTVVTSGARKRALLAESFEDEPIDGVPVQVALVPELIQLIAYQTGPRRRHRERGGGENASERL